MDNCIFCKLAAGSLPCMKVYENESTLVFMDTACDVDGHLLAIPKKHIKSILDCDDNSLCSLMQTVKKIAVHLTENCGYSGVNLLNASGESAGQSVQHFHIHIIPRKNEDNIDAWPRFEGALRKVEDVFDELEID